jgi:hypothetical protein
VEVEVVAAKEGKVVILLPTQKRKRKRKGPAPAGPRPGPGPMVEVEVERLLQTLNSSLTALMLCSLMLCYGLIRVDDKVALEWMMMKTDIVIKKTLTPLAIAIAIAIARV